MQRIPLKLAIGSLAVGVSVLALAQNAPKKKAPPKLKWEVQQLRKDNNEGLAVGDIDGDGKLDVVAGEYWYSNGDWMPQKVRRLEPFGKDYLQNNSDHLWDIDGDGDLDVVAGGYTTTTVNWFENPGPGGYDAADGWKQHLLVDTGTDRNELSFFQDIDGDDIPEWLENSWGDNNPTLAWKLGKGEDEKATLVKHVIGPDKNGHGMGFGDINGDGLEDIIFKQGWYECPKAGPFSGEWTYHDDFTFPHASCPMLVVDLDEDGRNDIIWADGHNYGIWWERQQEPQSDGSTTWRTYEIDRKHSQAHALAWDDIDNDGQPELITGKRYYAHSGGDPGAEDACTVQYYDWNKETKTWTKQLISTGPAGEAPGIGLQIRVADLDGNGWKDIAVPGKSGTHILWNHGWNR